MNSGEGIIDIATYSMYLSLGGRGRGSLLTQSCFGIVLKLVLSFVPEARVQRLSVARIKNLLWPGK